MNDPDIAYAVKEGPDLFELFDMNHVSLGFQSEEYITKYEIPLYSSDEREKAFMRRWGGGLK